MGLRSVPETPVTYKYRPSIHLARGGGTESDCYRKLGYNPTSLLNCVANVDICALYLRFFTHPGPKRSGLETALPDFRNDEHLPQTVHNGGNDAYFEGMLFWAMFVVSGMISPFNYPQVMCSRAGLSTTGLSAAHRRLCLLLILNGYFHLWW